MGSIFICFFGDLSKYYFKTVSFSSFPHLNYSLFDKVLRYANCLTFQDFFSFKNCIPDNVPHKFNDYRPKPSSGFFFFQVDGIYICHWLISVLAFLFLRFSNNFVSIFILVFFHTMDKRQFLLEYCSWCGSWKIPNNSEINHIMVSFADHYNAISIERLSSKTKIGKYSWERFMKIILFYVCPRFPQLQRFFFIKNTKNNYSSVSGWWEYTKYRFKENAKILSTNSITQQNITISRKKMLFFIKNTKTTSSASVWWGNINSSFK